MKSGFRAWLVSFGVLFCMATGWRATAQETTIPHPGMLRYPDVSATHIVFVYANDLWVVPRTGGLAVPLASPPGQETFPKFSPDGKTIAFVGNYEGNRDIYTVPLEGGIPYRVTHHPAGEWLSDWTPDGKLIFSASNMTGFGPGMKMYVVPAKGGLPEKLPIPYGVNGSISADGTWLAYTPHSTDFATWKRYRGGMATNIWLFNLRTKKSKRITDWEGTDTLPMWHGDKVYYLSDAGPEHRLNIWVYDMRTSKREQITRFTDFDVKWPSIGPGEKGEGEIVFQQGSHLYLLNLQTREAQPVQVQIPGARPTLRPRAVDVSRFIMGWGISPTGKRAVVEARGDIWTLPAKNGSPRNLTRTSGVAERDPSWSPDGQWIAYFSDATGEYEMYIVQSDGKGEPKQLTKDGACFRYNPVWSPNSKYIAFSDKTGALYVYGMDSGMVRLVDKDPWAEAPNPSWSPDSRWIAYARNDERTRNSSIWLYNVETDEKTRVTSGMFNDISPVFDRKGEYLYFVSHRHFRPIYEDLGTTWIYAGTQVLLAVPLRQDIASPYLPKTDEEKWGEKSKEQQPEKREASPALPAALSAVVDEVSGEWSGTVTGSVVPGGSLSIRARLKLEANNTVTGTVESPMGSASVAGTYNPSTKELALSVTLPDGTVLSLNAKITGNMLVGTVQAPTGETLELRAERVGGLFSPSVQPAKPESTPVSKPEQKVNIDTEGFEARAIQLPVKPGRFGRLAVNDKGQLIFARMPVGGSEEPPAINLFDITDEKRVEKTVATGASAFDISADGKKLLVIRGGSASIQDAAPGATGEPVVTAGMTAQIDPRAEWRQIFTDAWRIQRDFFYDPNMHGVDWKAMREHYAQMLEDCVSREDVSFVIGEMIAELNVGHAYYSGGDTEQAPSTAVGLLGCDFDLYRGAYRISKIYQGAPWDSDARGPLSQPGVKVKEGDYLLAVNGVPIDTSKDPWAAFQGMADRVITITVSDKPYIDDTARDVAVSPLGSDSNLRYRAWVESKRAYVEQKTGGRVGYIYVPNTGTDGQNDLVRQFIGQTGKDALIIDERWNGGGQIPTRFIELLNRPLTNYWARRDGNDWPWPPDAHYGPKCMLINGLAGSGGDAFPYYFRQAKLGKLIGTRTWGGLVGISGNPRLIDGGSTSAPTFAFYEKDGTWGIEGHGVDPDIEVIDDPALMVNGEDPQLDVAIQLMLDELKRNPYTPAKRPPYPNRKGMGIRPEDK
ncbi:MAG: S41 family peptidase [Armatimonadota bacterium]